MSEAPEKVHASVREHYGRLAAGGGCCGPAEACNCEAAGIYPADQLRVLPADITTFTLGCGNPFDIARLRQGEAVLDLGSGGGLDCFLASKQVGPEGHVIGVDMTPEMLERARGNARRLGIDNVEFRSGLMEELPVADESVDVVISNCVINLSPDKPRVFREIYRVLRPGGRLAVSDEVSNGPVPASVRDDPDAWGACISGALDFREYERGLREAGLTEVSIVPRKADLGSLAGLPAGTVVSAMISARKPSPTG